MSRFSLIRPIDQPLGVHRLLDDLKAALRDDRFADFRLIVAYARSGPLYRLQELLEEWRRKGKTSAAIPGIDQQGTSKDALELALRHFDRVHATREAGITFHPKMYLFTGRRCARAFIGSNNLTVGGTEKNFETAVRLALDLPEDTAELRCLERSWSDLLPASCPATTLLDHAVLERLAADKVVIAERAVRAGAGDGDFASVGPGFRSRLPVKPESPLPAKVLVKTRRARAKGPVGPKSHQAMPAAAYTPDSPDYARVYGSRHQDRLTRPTPATATTTPRAMRRVRTSSPSSTPTIRVKSGVADTIGITTSASPERSAR